MKGNSRRFDWGEDGEDERQSLTGGGRSSSAAASKNKRASVLAPTEEYERQARDIEELGGHVSAIKEISGEISSMILESHKDLDELQAGMERSQATIQTLTKRTEKMVELAGGPRYCCVIMILSGIALFLFMLVIYT